MPHRQGQKNSAGVRRKGGQKCSLGEKQPLSSCSALPAPRDLDQEQSDPGRKPRPRLSTSATCVPQVPPVLRQWGWGCGPLLPCLPDPAATPAAAAVCQEQVALKGRMGRGRLGVALGVSPSPRLLLLSAWLPSKAHRRLTSFRTNFSVLISPCLPSLTLSAWSCNPHRLCHVSPLRLPSRPWAARSAAEGWVGPARQARSQQQCHR